MPKIIVLKCVSDSGFGYDRIFVGNEFSRDPADIIQLASQQFKKIDWGDDKLHLVDDVTDEVILFLKKNGYEEYDAPCIHV